MAPRAEKESDFLSLRGPALCTLGGLLLTVALGMTISTSVGILYTDVFAFDIVLWYWLLILFTAGLGFLLVSLGLVYTFRTAQRRT
jgi:hypothetical protein